MSIATDEALHSVAEMERNSTYASRNNYTSGYIDGRTAPVTEKEIEAAARNLYELGGDSWDELHDESWKNHCRRKARIVITAARVSVTNE